MLEHVLDGARAAQPLLDVGRMTDRAPIRQQTVDVRAIAEIGRHTSRGRVRLTDEAQLLEPRHDVAQRRRGDPEAAAGEPQRRNRFAVLDVRQDQRAQDPSISFR